MEKPTVAGKTPQLEKLAEGKTYAWCACGKSEKQPWCNGAHSGSKFVPNVFRAEEAKTAAMCLCKQSQKPPYYDGSHLSL